ncbi:MAG TPA: hypothetical protein VMF08_19275 [Candidatus Sulfotelmatobacter sp.]|nr:hypothetical protein [Candidatus Sulfotelmatobacter sp.]
MKASRILVGGAVATLAIALTSCATPKVHPAVSTQPAAATADLPPPMPVSLAQYFNDQGIYPDGAQFPSSAGVDGDGYACSSNLLSVAHWNSVPFQIGGSDRSSNVITCNGQAIALAQPGHFSKLEMLAIAVNGAQANQPFTVVYADNSTQSFTQSLSDWAQPDDNPGELQAVSMDYRNQSDGSKDDNTFYLYSYSFSLNPTNTLQSLKLPDNDNVKVFGLTLVP